MSNVNIELEQVENSMADATIYDATRKDELKSLLDTQVNSKRQLERLESEWLQLNEEIEKLGSE
jgi:ATP-binding cassette subfamily F protein 3